jgi:hypothetical protein
MILYDQKEYKESLSKLWKACSIVKTDIEPRSRLQAIILTATGDVNTQLGNDPLALRCYEDAVSFYKIFFSHQHPLIVDLENKIKVLEEKSQTS